MHADADQEGADPFGRSLRLSDRQFAFLCQMIDENLGIQISKHKRSMLESRISRRMRELSLTSIGEYSNACPARPRRQRSFSLFSIWLLRTRRRSSARPRSYSWSPSATSRPTWRKRYVSAAPCESGAPPAPADRRSGRCA